MSEAVMNPRHAVDAYISLDTMTAQKLPVVQRQTAHGSAVLSEHTALGTLADDTADVV